LSLSRIEVAKREDMAVVAWMSSGSGALIRRAQDTSAPGAGRPKSIDSFDLPNEEARGSRREGAG
ncbi:hypothetical protein, partial [Mesorhizobium sp.]|uniref:hypothetical protein n=1 Tax=Mesorhizobium sp. TaxID=1871066 RepID=UPI0025D2078E